jgi:hypothetical protein
MTKARQSSCNFAKQYGNTTGHLPLAVKQQSHYSNKPKRGKHEKSKKQQRKYLNFESKKPTKPTQEQLFQM